MDRQHKNSNIINKYIIKNFIYSFFIIGFCLSLLIFIFSLLEKLKQFDSVEGVSNWDIIEYVLLEIPLTFNTIVPFAILIAGMFFFYKMSKSSEIVAIRSFGLSVWQIIKPICFAITVLAGIYMLIGNYSISKLRKQHVLLTYKYNLSSTNPFIFTKEGIWLREKNSLTNCFISAKGVLPFRNDFKLSEVNIFMFDLNNNFIKKVSGENGMLLNAEKKITLENVVVFEPNKFKINLDTFEYAINLDTNAIRKNTIYPDSIVFWNIPKHVKVLRDAGFATKEFEMYFWKVVFTPLSFLALFFVAVVFTLPINNRNVKFLYRISAGVAVGFLIYFSEQIFYTMGVNGSLPQILAIATISTMTLLGCWIYFLYAEE